MNTGGRFDVSRMAPGLFTSGHVLGLTNEAAAQITAQCQLSDKVRA